MNVPLLLAFAGIGLLVWEIWSLVFVRRALKAGRLSQQWRRRRIIAFIIGALLVVTIPWHHYPLGSGKAAGIPFLAVWFDAEGADYVGDLTLPALLGNLAVWFLMPQLVLAYFVRKDFNLQDETQSNAG